MKVAIGITTYRPPDHPHGSSFTERLRVCLPSIARLRDYGHEIDVIVVDDGSIQSREHIDTILELCKLHGFGYQLSLSNRGVSSAKNSCLRFIRLCQYDIGFLLDDDIEVIGDLVGFYDQRMRETDVKHVGYWSTQFKWIPQQDATINRVPVMKLEHTNGVCLVFRPEMLGVVGAFRVLPNKWSHEHVDWTARAVKAGLCPYPLDFVGSDRYLKIQSLNNISTVGQLPRAERVRMTNENRMYAEKFDDIYLPL